MPLDSLRAQLDTGPDDSRLARVADAALEVWSDLVPLTRLRAALPAALRLGRLARAESWLRCYPSMTDAELADYRGAAPRWLLGLIDDPPSGPARG
ncbi:unannotated protein [freshwater metagenome]|uniref:Unannotated protein n=1 Tax=freshwater metagenome TaxID=449393 RepID=A0A6J6S261_9ZZZZ